MYPQEGTYIEGDLVRNRKTERLITFAELYRYLQEVGASPRKKKTLVKYASEGLFGRGSVERIKLEAIKDHDGVLLTSVAAYERWLIRRGMETRLLASEEEEDKAYYESAERQLALRDAR